MSDKLTPITRKETFLAKAGGQNVVTPTPITREETFLQAIIDNGSGGGGGSDLPAVTSEDAGKVLTVSNDGEWVAGSGGGGGGGGVLVVGINMDTMTLDKTWKEIADAAFTIIKSPMSETANGYTLIFQTEAYNGTYSVLCAAFGVDEQGVVSLGQLIFETNSENGYPVLNMG